MIQFKRGTSTAWTSANPVLQYGQPGYDLTNNQIRVGDGTTPWLSLTPVGGSGGVPDGDKGDITVSGGGTTWTIDNGVVTLSKMANLAASTILGNNTGASATPIALTPTQVKTLLAITSSDVSGLASISTSGSASDLTAGTIPAARMPAHTGDVTSSAGSVALTIANDAVTNAKLENMAANTIKGNNTGAAADPIDLTAAQATALLDTFTSGLKGLAPASGGGTTNFLRADGTWAAPSGGGGGVLSGSATVTALQGYEESEVITATGVTPSSRVNVWLASVTDDDENDPEMLALSSLWAIAGTNQITVNMTFPEPTSGPIKILWSAV